METKQREKITDKPRMLKELAAAYGVNQKTFKSWLTCRTLIHILPEGYYYSIKQVNEIVNHLGEP
jgi:hypothetical protein